MSSLRLPKQWSLTKKEDLKSFERWRTNMLAHLREEASWTPYLLSTATWSRFSGDKKRGLVSEAEAKILVSMLQFIANFIGPISRSTVEREATSLESIWQNLREHYNLQSTGGNFLNFFALHRGEDDTPEDLYQTLKSFLEDSLLKAGGRIKHHALDVAADEVLTPTLENLLVGTWLQMLHQDLPQKIQEKFGHVLHNQTLASIKSDISASLSSMMSEIHTQEEVKIFRSSVKYPPVKQRTGPAPRKSFNRPQKVCPICSAKGERHDHFLSRCPHLPDQDKKFLGIRLITGEESESEDEIGDPQLGKGQSQSMFGGTQPPHSVDVSSNRKVQVSASPVLPVYYAAHGIPLTLDSGAETNLIRYDTAVIAGLPVSKSRQSAFQADGLSPLHVTGETHVTVNHGDINLQLDALIVSDLDVPAIAGTPFMIKNDVGLRPAQNIITIKNLVIPYPSSTQRGNCSGSIVLRSTGKQTAWPGGFLELPLPVMSENLDGCEVAIEPSSNTNRKGGLHCGIAQVVSGRIRLPNDSALPITIEKNAHVAAIFTTTSPNQTPSTPAPKLRSTVPEYRDNTSQISIDPDSILPTDVASRFRGLHRSFTNVFDGKLTGYNGAAGPIKARVNVGATMPPQRRGRVPQYQRSKLQLLQDKYDDLEAKGVFVRPEDVGVDVEYVNPSFLIKKAGVSNPSCPSDYRLVTAFAEVAKHCKPSPSLMPNCDSAIRNIARWKYLIKTDLAKAYFQIPLDKDSMKFCGVVTPFRGIRVYARSAMGMPGSEATLEELLSRVLGDLVYNGSVTKVADDLFCGSDSLDELLRIWEEVLQNLQKCNLKLSANKTVICPKSTTVLGWIWTSGSLSASTHLIAPLAACLRPETVKGLRSFIGSFKVLSRVVKNTAVLLSPLDDACAGKTSSDKLTWSEELTAAFTKAQDALRAPDTVTLPRPGDRIWIITDGSTSKDGLGATMYVLRNQKIKLAGFFSQKLKRHHHTWLPCEQEALAIASAIKHYAPYIIDTVHRTKILTDSKPCVQAYVKLQRGEFSSSPRVATFLSQASRYNVDIAHLAGTANLPSDFASRNAAECDDISCQVCKFVAEMEEATVMNVTVADILGGRARLPYTNKRAWIPAQQECPDIQQAVAYLRRGTRPGKKVNNRDLKRYVGVATIDRHGLLVVKREEPLEKSRDCVVIPRCAVDGLLTAMHLRLDHPTKHQLKLVFQRHFYAIDLDRLVESVSESCHQCASLKRMPTAVTDQTTSEPPDAVSTSFAADVFKLPRQSVLILRETVTSFTVATAVPDETEETLYNALVQLLARVRSADGPLATVRVDPAPGFQAIARKDRLRTANAKLEIGNPKNTNKNPVAESTIAELRSEIRRQYPDYPSLVPHQLEVICQRLNSRIRSRGLSSFEMMFHRDQFSHSAISLSDLTLMKQQHSNRLKNHGYNERSKLRSGVKYPETELIPGDIVYLRSDKNKNFNRPRYLVLSTDRPTCVVKKFTPNHLGAFSYTVNLRDCYKVPPFPISDLDCRFAPELEPEAGGRSRETFQSNIQNPQPESQSVVDDVLPIIPNRDTGDYQHSCGDGYSVQFESDVVSSSFQSQSDAGETEEGNRPQFQSVSESETVVGTTAQSQNDDDVAVIEIGNPRRSNRARKSPHYLKDYV